MDDEQGGPSLQDEPQLVVELMRVLMQCKGLRRRLDHLASRVAKKKAGALKSFAAFALADSSIANPTGLTTPGDDESVDADRKQKAKQKEGNNSSAAKPRRTSITPVPPPGPPPNAPAGDPTVSMPGADANGDGIELVEVAIEGTGAEATGQAAADAK